MTSESKYLVIREDADSPALSTLNLAIQTVFSLISRRVADPEASHLNLELRIKVKLIWMAKIEMSILIKCAT